MTPEEFNFDDYSKYIKKFDQHELLKQLLIDVQKFNHTEFETKKHAPMPVQPLIREYTTSGEDYPPLPPDQPEQRERITRLDRRELDKIIQSSQEEIREIDRELDKDDLSRENRKRLETRRKRVNAKISMAHVQIDTNPQEGD